LPLPSHPPPPRVAPSSHQFHLACKSGALLTAGWPEISPAASFGTGPAMAAAAVAYSSTPRPLRLAQRVRAPPRQRPAAPLPQAAARRLGLGRGGGGDQRVRPVLFQLHRVPLPARSVPQPPHHPHRGNLLVRPQAASRLLLPGDDRNGNFLTVSRVGARRPLGGVRR
jgi:hypothetical protein